MTDREISEIRRSLTPEKNCITAVCGCYVNEKREIISTFRKSFGLMTEEESDKYLSIFKKTLSGTPEKTLTDISFSTNQVLESPEHSLLTKLKASALEDESALTELYDKIMSCLDLDGNYLILMTHNVYDVPFKAKDGQKVFDSSDSTFSYILCSICPVKLTHSTLSYDMTGKNFISRNGDYTVGAPELGFMFPAFDDRCTNIYNALYYTRDASDNHREFSDVMFHTEIPMPAAEQKESFNAAIETALDDKCSISVVRAVHGCINQLIAEHKANREDPAPVVTKQDVGGILKSCGIAEENITKFEEKFDAAFGKNSDLAPQNIVETRKFELKAPDVVIKVKPDHTDLVETRVIDGHKYILIHAEGSVEVNGIVINIEDKKE